MKKSCNFALSLSLILTYLLSNGYSQETIATNWYRGNIHTHTFWSDGDVFPEQAADWYKENGYHFVALTDHGRLQEDEQRWVNVSSLRRFTDETLETLTKKYGAPETREVDGVKQIRLSTIHELKEKFDTPGRFLLIPGYEGNAGTSAASGGYVCEGNALNVTTTLPFPRLAPDAENLMETLDKMALLVRKNGEDHGHESEVAVNHPMWPYFDIDPLSLANAKEIRLYEFFCAGGGPVGIYAKPEQTIRYWNRESFWDIVNAFRAANGYPLLYGTATDDTHNYHTFGDNSSHPGRCWIVVRAEKLTADDIILALRRGDFYSSCGVEMEDIRFDKETGTLSVKVKPADGVKYRIQFIGTKKDFDRTFETFQVEKTESYPARKGWSFSKDIGIELLSVDGTEASYRLKEDDLYVRAIITSDQKKKYRDDFGPETATAWTQPYCP